MLESKRSTQTAGREGKERDSRGLGPLQRAESMLEADWA